MNTKKIVLSALMLAIGLILPFFTMQIPQFGNMLLPMHIPVLLCGFVCGAPYGAIIGFILPLLRSALFGMPVMMPSAMTMAVELMCYGFISGFLYSRFNKKRFGIYLSLIPALLIGRIAWGVAAFIVFGILGMNFTWKIFATQAFLNAIPGIILQCILIPVLVTALRNANIEGLNYGTEEISHNRKV